MALVRSHCASQQELAAIRSELDGRKHKSGGRQKRLTADQIEERLADLEYERTTSHVSIARDRSIMAEIAQLKASRRGMAAQELAHAARETLLDRRTAINAQLDGVFAELDELRAGLAVVDRLDRVTELNPDVLVTNDALLTEVVPVPEALVGRIVGKGGTNIRALEHACKAYLDAARKPNEDGTVDITVCGLPAGVAAAKQALQELGEEEDRHLDLPRGLISLFMAQAGERVRALEAEHFVRIRLDRQGQKAVVTGHPRRIASLTAAVEAFRGRSETIQVDTTTVPAIIGKNGANFRRLQGDLGIEVERLGSSEPGVAAANAEGNSLLRVWGDSHAAVREGVARLHELEEASKEHEVEHKVDREFIGFLLGDSGARVQAFRAEHRVRVNVGDHLGGGQWGITLKGTTAQLAGAEEAWAALLETFRAAVKQFPTSAAIGRSIIGVSGASIDKLRESTGAIVNVILGGAERGHAAKEAEKYGLGPTEALIVVRGEPEQVAAATEAVQAAIDSFTSQEVAVPHFLAAQLLASKAAQLQKLQEESGARLDLDLGELVGGEEKGGGKGRRGGLASQLREPATVTAVGATEAVEAAVASLRELVASKSEERVALPSEDAAIAFIGRGGEHIRALQAKHKEAGVSVDLHKPSKAVYLRGDSEGVAAAAEEVRAWAAEYAATNAVVSVPKDVIPAIIGKGGATIKKLTQDTGCTFDVDSRRGRVAVQGPAEALEGGVAALTALAGLDKDYSEMTGLNLGNGMAANLVGRGGAGLRALESDLGVRISVNEAEGSIGFRGDPADIARAKLAIRRKLRDGVTTTDTVTVPSTLIRTLLAKGAAQLRILEADTGVRVKLPPRSRGAPQGAPAGVSHRGSGAKATITLRGGAAGVARAQAALQALAEGKGFAMLPLLAPQLEHLLGKGKRNLERVTATHRVELDTTPAPGQNLDELAEDVGLASMLGEQGAAAADATQRSQALAAAVADVALEPGLVTLTGTTEAVAGATSGIHRLLEYQFPGLYMAVDVPSTLLGHMAMPLSKGGDGGAAADSDVGTPAAGGEEGEDGASTPLPVPSQSDLTSDIPNLAQVVERHAVFAFASRHAGCIVVAGPEADAVAAAVADIQAGKATWAERHGEVPIEEWMQPALVGKKGANIRKLESKSGCRLSLERDGVLPVVALAGRDAQAVAAGLRVVQERVTQLAQTRAHILVDAPAVPAIIGKGGATIKQLTQDTGCSINLGDRAGSDPVRVEIRGDTAEATAAGKAAVLALLAEEGYEGGKAPERDFVTEEVELYGRDGAAAVVGKGGATVRGLQDDTGARLRVDRDLGVVVISGTAAEVEAASAAVRKVLAEAKAAAAERQGGRREGGGGRGGGGSKGGDGSTPDADAVAPAPAEPTGPHIPVGTSSKERAAILAAAANKGTSKAARRREKARAARVGLLGDATGPDADALLAQLADVGGSEGAPAPGPTGTAPAPGPADDLLQLLGSLPGVSDDVPEAAVPAAVEAAAPGTGLVPPPGLGDEPVAEARVPPPGFASPAPTKASLVPPPGFTPAVAKRTVAHVPAAPAPAPGPVAGIDAVAQLMQGAAQSAPVEVAPPTVPVAGRARARGTHARAGRVNIRL